MGSTYTDVRGDKGTQVKPRRDLTKLEGWAPARGNVQGRDTFVRPLL